ncbi:MAG: hypothetical protein L0H96_03195 [Humibacillus sp.]|nr:hypothetical protein [Humibacillus sp.]MDN5775898.1 hypothetical protein [Humibacillus sp.]
MLTRVDAVWVPNDATTAGASRASAPVTTEMPFVRQPWFAQIGHGAPGVNTGVVFS